MRVNSGLFDVGGTATATNSGKVVIDLSDAIFKANKLVTDTGTLEWNSGALWITDDLYIETGSPLQSRTISENQTLISSNAFGAAIWFQDSAVLTLDGGKIICENFFKTDAATLNFYDGEFPKGVGNVRVSGAGSYWNGGGDKYTGGEFLVGRYGSGTVLVENGATLRSSGYSELGNTYSTHATGIVTIANGGRVIVNDGVSIGYSSILMGNGGTIQANVDNINGEINPGSSVGILTVDGTF